MSKVNPVGVIGAGSFGAAVANLLAENQPVLLYERNKDTTENMRRERKVRGFDLHPNIQMADSLEQVATECFLIFPAVPSQFFKSMIIDFSPYLRPDHIMIHTTKGLHCEFDIDKADAKTIRLKDIKTMSELILQETGIVR
ncbi:MAG TPA: NAD(P)-binding domain-containing protein, partial [Chitinophagales bacterium]|nr:NAD(P)-binding domain-containing protein [Chitinophagales bacterium]